MEAASNILQRMDGLKSKLCYNICRLYKKYVVRTNMLASSDLFRYGKSEGGVEDVLLYWVVILAEKVFWLKSYLQRRNK